MNRICPILASTLLAIVTLPLRAQDDDHTTTNGTGITLLAPNGNVPAAPAGVTIGTAANGAAAFVVEGSQMATPTGEVFRTIGHYASGAEQETNWRMYRLQSNGAPREMGRLWAATSAPGGTTNYHFNVQSMVQGGSLWLRNQSTNGIRIHDDAASTPSFTYNGQTNTGQRFAYVGIGQAGTIGSAPWARLHLTHRYSPAGTAIEQFFRGTMQNGVMMSGDNDAMYVGQQHVIDGTQTADEATNALFSWGEQNLPTGDHDFDNATFRFFATPGASNVGSAGTTAGLEFIRLYPYRLNSSSAIQNYVGIGDWASGSDRPSERLDLLDRTIRLRNFTDNTYLNNSYDRVLVVNPADGRVHWRQASTLTGATDCDWEIETAANRLHTAWRPVGSNTTCPELDWRMGIGTNAPTWKLHVEHNASTTSGAAGGIYAGLVGDGGATEARGIQTNVTQPTSLTAVGMAFRGEYSNPGDVGSGAFLRLNVNRADVFEALGFGSQGHVVASNGHLSQGTGVFGRTTANSDAIIEVGYGVQGEVICENDEIVDAYGVWGKAFGGSNLNYGVFGKASGNNAWAGWFDGNVKITNTLTVNTTVYTSDAALKTNIEPAAACLPIINALQPKRYVFTDAAVDALNLDTDQHVGLIAQELEEVLPTLVHDIAMPAEHDSLGNVLSDQWSYKGVDYVALIPYLIGAVKELSTQNAQMQEQLAACCSSPNDDGTRSTINGAADEGAITPSQERLLRIAPNPFTDRTTLYYTLERAGRMQLLVNSSDGRDLIVLSEALREAGEHQQVWSTENLAPGVYYVTLLLDGEPVVKRAVKVGR